MTEQEKLWELVRQVHGIFPNLTVAPVPDVNVRWRIECLDESDLKRSLRFTVPRNALDDLHPVAISDFMQRAEHDGWWQRHPGETLHIGYEVDTGLLIPAET